MIATCLKRMLACVLAALLVPLPAQSQVPSWRFDREFYSQGFGANIYPAADVGFSLMCAGRAWSGAGVAPLSYEGWSPTGPGVLRLILQPHEIGRSTSGTRREDIVIVIGPNAYRLPGLFWNEQDGEWTTDLQATGPMFDAIAASQSFEIHSNGGVLSVGSSGFAAAYSTLLSTCQSLFAENGQPWAPGPRAALLPGPDQSGSMRQAAEAAVAWGCNGASTYEPGAFLSGNIDGDGVADVVLDWRAITCAGSDPRPFCGASSCSASAFLSQAYPMRQKPLEMLGLGVRLQPLDNGADAIALGGSLMECSAVGLQACEFLYYWNGADLVPLQ